MAEIMAGYAGVIDDGLAMKMSTLRGKIQDLRFAYKNGMIFSREEEEGARLELDELCMKATWLQDTFHAIVAACKESVTLKRSEEGEIDGKPVKIVVDARTITPADLWNKLPDGDGLRRLQIWTRQLTEYGLLAAEDAPDLTRFPVHPERQARCEEARRKEEQFKAAFDAIMAKVKEHRGGGKLTPGWAHRRALEIWNLPIKRHHDMDELARYCRELADDEDRLLPGAFRVPLVGPAVASMLGQGV